MSDYGIVGSVSGPDATFRMGAKVWLAGGTGGEGQERFIWLGHSRGGRIVQKWAPTRRMRRFRAAWVPEHLRERVWYIRGSKDEMTKMADKLNELA